MGFGKPRHDTNCIITIDNEVRYYYMKKVENHIYKQVASILEGINIPSISNDRSHGYENVESYLSGDSFRVIA